MIYSNIESSNLPRSRRAPLFGPILLAFALTLSLLSGAAGAEVRQLEQMEHRRWMGSDGGPSQVGAIAQTRDGYLWLGTNDSLARFDGHRFVRHQAGHGQALGTVSALLAVDNALWVGLRTGGVAVVEGQATRVAASGLPGGAVYALAREAGGGAIWAAADDGLARFDGVRWQRIGSDWKFPGRKARAVFADRSGVVWAANENRLFHLPQGARAFADTGLGIEWASQIAQAPDGSIWLTERYSGRVHRVVLNGGKAAVESSSIGAAASGLLFDRSGGLWISTLAQGLQYVAQPSGIGALALRQTFGSEEGLSSRSVWPMFEDREGALWVGTNAGLDRLRARTLTPSGFPPGTINAALAAGSDGAVWGGGSGHGAMRLLDGRLIHSGMPAPVTCAMRDAAGHVWMAGPNGIWRSSGAHLVRVTGLPASAGADSSVRAMALDAAGDLWVSLNRLGLFKLHDGQWQPDPAPTAEDSQLMPVSASTDQQGRLWFGYRNNLLVMRDGASVRRWGSADGMRIGHVTAFAHHGGRTWIGGQHGVGYIEGGRFTPLRLPVNDVFGNVYALLLAPPRNGAGADLWIQSKSGIFQIRAEQLARAGDGRPVRYRSFDLMAGLANDPYQVLPLPTAVQSRDGRLWFSTGSGIASIDPRRLTPEDAPPAVTIESVVVDGVRSGDASAMELKLKPDSGRIAFQYAALSLSAPEGLEFRYRMDGYDTAWQEAGRQREAVYTSLPSGGYVFRVLARNKDGLSSAQEATLAIHIATPLYRRPWFVLLAALAAGVLLWVLHRLNLRRVSERLRERLEERHSERERIARELHDTLLQGVQGLTLRFQAAADRISAEHPAYLGLEQALTRADEVLIQGRDRVRGLRRGLDDAGDLHEALLVLSQGLQHQGGPKFQIHVTGSKAPMHPIVCDELFWIAHEAIANAFIHAQARHVEVRLDYSAQQFVLRVRDDGRGIDPSFLAPGGRPDHWGLRGMGERARKIGANLTIRSEPGRGSEIVLSMHAALAFRERRRGALAAWFRWRERRAASRAGGL